MGKLSDPTNRDDRRLVFISHSSTDTWVARQLARAIEEAGAVAFLDEAEIEVGADFENDILSVLERADELLALLTPWALKRAYVWAEMGAAWGRRIPIIGLLHGTAPAALQSRKGVPVLLKRRNMIELNDVDHYLEQLRRRVATQSIADGKDAK